MKRRAPLISNHYGWKLEGLFYWYKNIIKKDWQETQPIANKYMVDKPKSLDQSQKEFTAAQQDYIIRSWIPEEAEAIYIKLEHPNWAPWLEATPETLAGRSKTFTDGQIVMKDLTGKLLASLSLNRINWDGNIKTLPTWDMVAGQNTTDYSETYDPHGNTLVLMSMNVAPDAKGKQLPAKLVAAAQKLAKELSIKYLIGSFRPSGYGKAKKEYYYELDFNEYCHQVKDGTDRPYDPWLRSLSWVGMEMMVVDNQAMTVSVSFVEFNRFRQTYHSDKWVEISLGVWECEEVGTWIVDEENNIATYKESNMWGRLTI